MAFSYNRKRLRTWLLLLLLLLEQLDEIDAGGLGLCRFRRLGRRQPGIDDGIDESGGAVRLALKINLDAGGVERSETHFDGLTGQMRRRFAKTILESAGRVA